MAHKDSEMIRGTLDMLVLRTISTAGSIHGYEIAQRIRLLSQEALRVEEGSRLRKAPFTPRSIDWK